MLSLSLSLSLIDWLVFRPAVARGSLYRKSIQEEFSRPANLFIMWVRSVSHWSLTYCLNDLKRLFLFFIKWVIYSNSAERKYFHWSAILNRINCLHNDLYTVISPSPPFKPHCVPFCLDRNQNSFVSSRLCRCPWRVAPEVSIKMRLSFGYKTRSQFGAQNPREWTPKLNASRQDVPYGKMRNERQRRRGRTR